MPAKAEHVIRFIGEALVHTKGKFAGSRFTVYDFQGDWIEAILALDAHGRRKVREFLLGVARKNGKTELIAALAVALLLLEEEPGGDVVVAAGKRDQARILLNAARKMVKLGSFRGQSLDAAKGGPLEVRKDSIYFPEMDATLGAVSADAQNEQGLNPNVAIVDELHVASEKNDDLYQALMTAQGARENPLMIAITTAGPIPKGPCYDLYKYGTDIAEGKRPDDPDFRMIWHQADAGCAVDDPEQWAKASPALGKFLFLPFYEKASRAVLAGKAPEYVFRRLQLNQWTTATERWLPFQKWDACGDAPIIPPDSPILVAVDAALSRDTFAVVYAYVEKGVMVQREDGLVVPTSIVHVRGRRFVPDTEGGYIDPADVEAYILGLGAMHAITEVAYDPAYMGLMASSLADRGVNMEAFPQTAERMTHATETLQRVVLDNRLRHGNDRHLNEQMAAVGTAPTDRGVRISKRKSGLSIDLVTALAMALDRAVGDEDSETDDFLYAD